MSSAMMTRMLGFCGCWAAAGATAVVATAAKASNPGRMFLAKPIKHSSGFLNALEAASDDFVSARCVANSRPRIKRPALLHSVTLPQELLPSLCNFGRNAVTAVRSGGAAAPAVPTDHLPAYTYRYECWLCQKLIL